MEQFKKIKTMAKTEKDQKICYGEKSAVFDTICPVCVFYCVCMHKF